jgi:hypothetical protein
MNAVMAVSALALGCLWDQAADMTLSEKDLGLNACVLRELDGCFKERPKDLPTLDGDALIGWVKAGVKLDAEQQKKVDAMKARLRGRLESFKRFVLALGSVSDRMAKVKNEREQKRLQSEAKELNDRFQKEFPSPTANLTYNPLSDLSSWLEAVLSEEQASTWRSELRRRFGDVASTVTIEKVDKETVTGKLLARRCDYDFGKSQALMSYLVLTDDKVIYVAPAEVAKTADHHDAVRITSSAKGDRR